MNLRIEPYIWEQVTLKINWLRGGHEMTNSGSVHHLFDLFTEET